MANDTSFQPARHQERSAEGTDASYEHAARQLALRRLLGDRHFKTAVIISSDQAHLQHSVRQYADKVISMELSEAVTWGNAVSDKPDLIIVPAGFEQDAETVALLQKVLHLLSEEGCAVIEAVHYSGGKYRLSRLIRHRRKSEEKQSGGTAGGLQPIEPKRLVRHLRRNGVRVERILSVSCLRNVGMRRILPRRVLLAFEGILQPTLAKGYLGPSIFLLIRKDI